MVGRVADWRDECGGKATRVGLTAQLRRDSYFREKVDLAAQNLTCTIYELKVVCGSYSDQVCERGT